MLILSILCILYGLIIGLQTYGSTFYRMWYVVGFVFFCLYWIQVKQIYIPSIFKILFFIAISVAIFLFLLILSGYRKSDLKSFDFVLILGAQWKTNGPSKALRYRLEKAVDYLSCHPDTICIVTGGKGKDEPIEEAMGMKNYLEDRNITNQILVESKSTSTLENIVFSKQFVDLDASIAIITNDFHVYRAIRLAKKQGFKHVEGIPAGSHLFYAPNNIFREMVGLVKEKIVGNI